MPDNKGETVLHEPYLEQMRGDLVEFISSLRAKVA